MIKREVVYATQGKDESTIQRFCEEITNHNTSSENIKNISMDMSTAYILGAKKYLPTASVTFDKFLSIRADKEICQNDKIALFWCVAIFQKQAYSRSNRRNQQPYPRNQTPCKRLSQY